MRILKSVIIYSTIAGLLFAGQTGKIAGTITDSQSGGGLAGCNVLVKGTPFGASSDANGEYYIINLSPGSYDLEFSMIGYASYTAEGVSVNIDVTTPVNAALVTEAVQMSGVSVTAEKPAIENTLTSSKQIVSGDGRHRLLVSSQRMTVRRSRPVIERTGRSAGNGHRVVCDPVQVCQQVLAKTLQFMVRESRVQCGIAKNLQRVLPIRLQRVTGYHRVLTIRVVAEAGSQEFHFLGDLDTAPGSGPFGQHTGREISQP